MRKVRNTRQAKQNFAKKVSTLAKRRLIALITTLPDKAFTVRLKLTMFPMSEKTIQSWSGRKSKSAQK